MSDSDPDDTFDLDDFANLVAVLRFTRRIEHTPWFEAIGQPLDDSICAEAEAYLSALGFPGTFVADVAGWGEAEIAAENMNWNPRWWEAEEQLRAALTTDALTLVAESELSAALTHVAAVAAEVVPERAEAAAARAGMADEELIRAATGAATQACHQAALVLAAAAEPDHPLAIKFRLFEAGHWPLGIAGTTFHLF